MDTIGEDSLQKPSSILGNWHANLLCIERRNCVLFTNDQTLYSIFLPKLVKKDFQNLAAIFIKNLALNLENEACDQHVEGIITEYKGNIAFTKASNRSVLGSMNDIAQKLKWFVSREGGLDGCDFLKLNHKINHMPFAKIKYHYPIECLNETLQK
jgi:hypothetical protein